MKAHDIIEDTIKASPSALAIDQLLNVVICNGEPDETLEAAPATECSAMAASRVSCAL